MFKTIKTISFIIAISLAFTTISCLDPVEELTPRTPEMEAVELNEVLDKLEADGYDIDTTDLGIYYIMYEAGPDSLPQAQAGDTCFLEYTGYLLDGTIFDASAYYYDDAIWEFIYKENNLISGFDDGIALMNKGAKIDMIIPSELAYGVYGQGNIQPYTTLMFSAIMHDLKPKAE
ncbi:MAG: FKBP-type peptidyl-prolyl cis-trans isomerase [Victivallaceae bacterium]|nr:FKBP-type peptidyl-prolyl cis-trans isomerase [Victivallaceae bacterium]